MRIIIIIIFIDLYKFTACLSVFPALIIVFAACSYICCVQLRTPYNIAIKRCPEISITYYSCRLVDINNIFTAARQHRIVLYNSFNTNHYG